MYHNILVPTDGSDAAKSAIPHAVDIAATREGTIHALSVIDTDELRFEVSADQRKRLEAGRVDEIPELHEQATAATAPIVDEATNAGVEATDAIRTGTPHTEIVSYARTNGIDLIVMGSHGRSGVGRLLLGSVTERVIRTTSVPVLVVDISEAV